MSKLPLFVTFLAVLAGPIRAEVPQVVTDIAPIHALTAQVMDGVGVPELLVRPGLSPHSYALRPSQARALQDADLVVWVGEGLAPWLEKPLASLAGGSDMLELMEAEGTVRLAYRGAEDVLAAAAGPDDHGDHADHDGHEDHGDHADHAAEASHEDHDDHDGTAEGEAGHHHTGAYDPHAWLDPQNGSLWLGLIAEHLSALDPEHAETYRANAIAGQAEISAAVEAVTEALRPMQGVAFVSYHDAFQYFERRFGLTLVGTVTPGDATDPSPAQLAQLRDRLADLGVRCAFAEPQFDTRLLQAAVAGRDIPILELDPLGRAHELGKGLYPALIRDLGTGFAACVGG
ncbi:zinc ABC transporter substrate-binding protein [Antarcticimicrobium sediminis]|uniref:High-affinity zinc uptake system protein ZnuA n=1 Tax=Antarcticimicrobium sediminis TaxID=2546227 RepID=A0A4R5ESX7_9RHOB|nr:zinc ABC transporter substrate-binding protein [Antarcticimicrobium sediminis]TDE38001.1 zinc transporter [Antarcticimicrobium sediminis]